jgi:hypothetical protein
MNDARRAGMAGMESAAGHEIKGKGGNYSPRLSFDLQEWYGLIFSDRKRVKFFHAASKLMLFSRHRNPSSKAAAMATFLSSEFIDFEYGLPKAVCPQISHLHSCAVFLLSFIISLSQSGYGKFLQMSSRVATQFLQL